MDRARGGGRRRAVEGQLDTTKKEVASLLEKVDLLSKERRYTEEDFGRAVDDKVAEAMSNFVATSVANRQGSLRKRPLPLVCMKHNMLMLLRDLRRSVKKWNTFKRSCTTWKTSTTG